MAKRLGEPRLRRAVLPVLEIILGLLILWVPFAPFASPKPSRLWHGYYTVLVRSGSRADSVLGLAVQRLGPGVISEYTATVDFYDFASTGRSSYAHLAKRLDPLDPRRDPFIDGMAGYFSVTDGSGELYVLYVPARSSPFALFRKLWRLLGPSGNGAWRIVDFDPLEKILSMAAVVGFCAFVTLGGPKRRRGWAVLVAASLLWLPSVLEGGLSSLSFSLLSLGICLPLLRARLAAPRKGSTAPRGIRSLFFLYIAAGVVALAVSFFIGGSSFPGLIQLLAPWTSSLLLVALVPFLSRAVEKRRKVAVFTAVPVIRSAMDSTQGRQRALTLALFSLVIVTLVPFVRGAAFPAPSPLRGQRGLSWGAVIELRQGAKKNRLPDFSDFVAHEAYQQTLGFGMKWRQPVPDQHIYGREYLVDPVTGVIHATLRTVKVLDSMWLASLTMHPAPSGLESLLVAQGGPAVVSIRGPARLLAGELPFTSLAFLSILCLLCWDLQGGARRAPRVWVRFSHLIRGNLWRLNEAARRDQIS